MVSVVTICNGQLGKLQWTYRSLKAQETSGWEWIVVNVGEHPEISEWLHAVHEVPVCHLPIPEAGKYGAMQAGVEAAHGEWVLFMEAGNRFFMSSTFRRAMAELADELDFVAGATVYETRYGQKVWQVRPYEVIDHERPLSLDSALIRRRLLLRYPLSDRYRWAGDYAFLYRIVRPSVKALRCPMTVVDRLSWWNHPDYLSLEREYREIQGRMDGWGDKMAWIGFEISEALRRTLRVFIPDIFLPDRANNKYLYR